MAVCALSSGYLVILELPRYRGFLSYVSLSLLATVCLVIVAHYRMPLSWPAIVCLDIVSLTIVHRYRGSLSHLTIVDRYRGSLSHLAIVPRYRVPCYRASLSYTSRNISRILKGPSGPGVGWRQHVSEVLVHYSQQDTRLHLYR